ncbi:MAG: PQQ-like beta-propeller repeat protein [Candidatus Hydrogenedentes bacterium]|nr:PQQ-like beta-propeller repeat protein [Candidatus Hydrogenedentota bacterium]
MDEAVNRLVGRQVRTIDEITRHIRDYEVEFGLLLEYRTKIKDALVELN